MSKNYDIDQARVSFIESTGQVEYTLHWNGAAPAMSGTNLNDGTTWDASEVEKPERFGPCATTVQFLEWAAAFVKSAEES